MKRVIHLVEQLGQGATENWLLRMLEYGQNVGADLQWTFYCYLPTLGGLEDRARELGARVVISREPLRHYIRFGRELREELRTGDYDILHAHHDVLSGLYLSASVGLPLRRKIVHVHNTRAAILTNTSWKQQIYERVLRQACLNLADVIAGVSNPALDCFLAGRPRRPGRDVVVYSGVSAAPFIDCGPDRDKVRQQLELSTSARIVLFVGRLVDEKNPLYCLDVLSELRKVDDRVVLAVAGEGPLRHELRQRAEALDLTEHVRFLGWRDDIANIMKSADLMIVPNPDQPLEGFGLVVLEAQLAGLPLLLSPGISDDPILPTAKFRRLSISQAPREWASIAVTLMNESAPDPVAAWRALSTSPMAMDRALSNLLALYS